MCFRVVQQKNLRLLNLSKYYPSEYYSGTQGSKIKICLELLTIVKVSTKWFTEPKLVLKLQCRTFMLMLFRVSLHIKWIQRMARYQSKHSRTELRCVVRFERKNFGLTANRRLIRLYRNERDSEVPRCFCHISTSLCIAAYKQTQRKAWYQPRHVRAHSFEILIGFREKNTCTAMLFHACVIVW
jgi:hypothetical protein